MWWPRDVWGRYAPALDAFKQPEHAGEAVQCLNHMVTNALGHAESCLDYMSRLRQVNVFRFCAIPQIMAIATLSMCYNNHNVFTGVVKMRRGEVAKVMYHLDNFADVCVLFCNYALVIADKAKRHAQGDPNQQKTIEACDKLAAACDARLQAAKQAEADAEAAARSSPVPLATRIVLLLVALLYALYAYRIESVRTYFGIPTRPDATAVDQLNQLAAAIFLGYAGYIGLTGRKV